MNEQQEKELVEYAKAWLTRSHVGRSEEQKDAYAEGVQDALMAIFQYTAKGAYPAYHAYDELEKVFFEQEIQNEK